MNKKMLGKLGFTGAQSTGKTEKCKELFKRYRIPVIREIARCCPFPINKQATRNSQLWIFVTMVKRELEYGKNFPGGFCCDRTLADVLAYSESDGFNGLSKDFWAFTQGWMNTYSKIFFCRPSKDIPPTIDHVRDASPFWRAEIDRRIEGILKSMGIKYIEVKSIEDVIKEIDHEVQ